MPSFIYDKFILDSLSLEYIMSYMNAFRKRHCSVIASFAFTISFVTLSHFKYLSHHLVYAHLHVG